MNQWGKLVVAFLALALIATSTAHGRSPAPRQSRKANDPHTEEALTSVDLKERLLALPPRRLPIRERLNHRLRRLAEATTYGGAHHYAAARS